jgi:hypothetical protein
LPRSFIQLAAGVLIVVLAAATAATLLELRYRAPQGRPAGLDLRAYQTMVNRDVTRFDSAGNGTSCATLQSTCPMPGRPVVAALQRWLDDLMGSETPARFAVIDVQLRRHLAATISDLDAVVAAYQARDQNGLDRANHALQGLSEWLDGVAGSIVASRQETVAAYMVFLRLGNDTFLGCASCQSLVSISQLTCLQIQTAPCQNEVLYAMATIETLETTPVRYAAPTSLATQDLGLQQDLAQADTAVLVMANAELTADQAGFDAGRLLLQQALPAVKRDIADILGG